MKRFARYILSFAVLWTFLVPGVGAHGEQGPAMTVWKSPWCGCCRSWVDHMRANGFQVTVEEVEDLDPIKKLAGIPEKLQSCHTARIGNYTIEGHVPAADIRRLLSDQPAARGLAVPGMPSGSPGMENGQYDPYDVLLIGKDGKTGVYQSYER